MKGAATVTTNTGPVSTAKRRSVAAGAVLVAMLLAVVGYSMYSSGTEEHLSVDSFASLARKEGTVLLDVRTVEEFDQGHLPGARNLDATSPTFHEQLQGMDRNATYAIYCCTGKRSAATLEFMKEAGFTDVSDLDGGYTLWVREGMKVTT
jgi:phage shock protein E